MRTPMASWVRCGLAAPLNGNLPTPKIDTSSICKEILDELARADAKHPPMSEPREGFLTLKCEVTELEREVFRVNVSPKDMRREAVQVGAMAIKFLRDCCGGD